VVLVVVTAGVLISNGLPSASPLGSGAIGSPPTSTPVGTPTAGFPTTIFGIDVRSVPDAILVRDGIGDSPGEEEIAVAGWYQQAGPVFCPVEPTEPTEPAGPLDGGCTLATQWLMADPETLVPLPDTMLGGPSPAGPAIRPVFDRIEAGWGYPISVDDSMPRPVVFLGHFNDARADDCRTEPRQECRALFVVDQVPWVDGAAYDAVFPADIDGIPVWTVERTFQERDAGELHGIEVAIGGWYSAQPIALACGATIEPWGYLEHYCTLSREVLADVPQQAHLNQPPIGTGLQPVFAPLWNSPVPDEWTPQPVVLVGHFDDPLALACRPEFLRACIETFVVDRLAWLDGAPSGMRVFRPWPPNLRLPSQDPLDIARFVRQQLPADGIVQSMTAAEARDVIVIDPTVDLGVDDLAVVWYVRAVESGTHQVGSFVVDDATGELIWSAFPMPEIEVP
jgi:hypothetical protein